MKKQLTLLSTLFALVVLLTLSFLYRTNPVPQTTVSSTAEESSGLSRKTLEEVSDISASTDADIIPQHRTVIAPAMTDRHNTAAPGPVAKLPQAPRIQMYNEQPFTKELSAFFPFERIYVVMTFPCLEAGEYPFSAHWIDPAGKTVNTANHTLSLKQPATQKRIFFWLELMKNGAFTEMFTGEEYRGNVHGSWQVEIYLDHNLLGSQTFQIHD